MSTALANAVLTTPADGTVTDAKFAAANWKDEDNMASDSDTAVSTQQSIKAYADAVMSGTMALAYMGFN